LYPYSTTKLAQTQHKKQKKKTKENSRKLHRTLANVMKQQVSIKTEIQTVNKGYSLKTVFFYFENKDPY